MALQLLPLLLLLTFTLAARAGDGHGWAIVPDDVKASSRDDTPPPPRFVVLHIPPTTPGSPQGVVRAAQWLLKEPERLCWQDSRVYLVMPSETIVADSRREIRRVLSIEARYSIAGAWNYLPPDGPELLPSLPGDGELVGFVGTPAGPIALLRFIKQPATSTSAGSAGEEASPAIDRSSTPPQATWRLLILDGRDWLDLTPPPPWQPSTPNHSAIDSTDEPQSRRPLPELIDARVHLIPTPDGIGLFLRSAESASATWWTARITRPLSAETFASSPSLAWTAETYPLLRKETNQPLGIDSVFGIDGRPVALSYRDSVMTAYLLLPTGPVEIARKQGASGDYRVVPRGGASGEGGTQASRPDSATRGSGILSILWPDPVSAADAPAPSPDAPLPVKAGRHQPRVFHLFEFFATGRVLYDGPARQDGPLSIREVQLLSIILGAILIAVIAFVLKPEQRPNDRLLKLLPRGFVMAGTARRAIASVMDFAIGIVAARAVLRLSWDQVLDPGSFSSQQGGLMLMAVGFALTWMHATIMEWQLGTTFGKMLVDCRVISLRPPAPLTPGSSDGSSPGQTSSPSATPQHDHARPASTTEPTPFKITLRQAAIRNLLKWIPPFSLAVFIGPRPRHFADQAAGTLVVESEVKERQASE